MWQQFADERLGGPLMMLDERVLWCSEKQAAAAASIFSPLSKCPARACWSLAAIRFLVFLSLFDFDRLDFWLVAFFFSLEMCMCARFWQM